MAVHPLLPNLDFRNLGWSLVGSGVAALVDAIANDDDGKYVQSPSSKSEAAVRFPVDITDVPEGAVVTSVTLKMRAGLGGASIPAGVIPSISLALSADDNTARFITRTVFPTTATPQTFEVATLDRDALGFTWDIERINHIVLKFFSYVGIFDLIRIFKLFCEVNYRFRPVVTIDEPNGTVYTPSPVLSWRYSQEDGDPQRSAEYKVFTTVQRAQVGFDPETSAPVFHGTVEGDIQSLTLPTSLNPDDYWVYVRVQSTFRARSRWVGRQFTVSGPAPGIPGVDDPEGNTVGVIQVVPDSEGGAAMLTLRDTSNLLSAQVSDAEQADEGAVLNTTLCAVARDTGIAFPGGRASWKVTATGGGTASVYTDFIEVDSTGAPVTARCQFLADTTGRDSRVRILFYDSNFALISSLTGTVVNSSSSTWREATVTGPVPAGTTYARLAVDILTPGAGEVHFLDRLGLMYGTNTPWSSGGQASRNLLSAWYSTAEGTPLAGEAWQAGVATSIDTAAPTGTGGSGSTAHRMTYEGLTPTIAWRAAGATFNSATAGTNYTMTKPAGVLAGDLMLAFVTCDEYLADINPPDGWTLADTVKVEDGSTDTTMFVLKRTAGGSEPASWTDGTLTVSSDRRTAYVVAYSGAADASEQFLASGSVASANPTPLHATTAPMVNTDPGAWRISAFAVSDNASGGTLTANRQQPSSVPGIEYVGRSSAWTNNNGSNTFTIYRPSNVQEGDFMIAVVSLAARYPSTVNPPSGWTLVHDGRDNSSADSDVVVLVMTRFAGASEPNSWSGSVSGAVESFDVRVSQVAAYRNVNPGTPFIAEDGLYRRNTQNIPTPAVINTNSGAWRVCAFGADVNNSSSSWTSNENTERFDSYASKPGGWFESAETTAVALFDSNGPVSTGSHGKTGTYSQSFAAAVSWIGLLNPLSVPPSPVADETARQVVTVGASNPWMTTRTFDSNGVVPTGNQTISGIWAPGSGSDLNAIVGWSALIVPAAPATSGYASAEMATTVDLTRIDPLALRLCDNKVAVTASFVGSVASTPYLTLHCWRANVLLNSFVVQGNPFGTDTWVKSAAAFDMPAGTTRLSMTVSASNLAVGDEVMFDRLSIALGDALGYRPGTSRSTHPVWSRPDIQFADDTGDGYTPFEILPGSLSNSPSFDILSGTAIHTDHTIVPLTNRKYRARTVVFGLAGDHFVSDFGPESGEFSFEAENWWIKDIENPDNNLRLTVKWDTVSVTTKTTAAVFQPLGTDLPVVLSEGYKGDSFTLKMTPVEQTDWAKLYKVLQSGRSLFLQSDVNHAWWVRPTSDLQSDILPTNTRRSRPLREITVSFVQVEPEL